MIFEQKKVLELINSELNNYDFGNNPSELYDPIDYILSLGGKRLRPFLTLFSTYLFGEDYSTALKPALAIEVFHNFTLMHDDIMDNAPLRRNKPTVHEKWNRNVAILSGDVMMVRSYDLLLNLEKNILPEAIALFNKCAAEVCEGQQLDMNYEQRSTVSEEEYLEMIRLKTAVLLGFSLRLGALIAHADNKSSKLIEEFGINLGLAFQLKDDLLDVFGEQEKFGKKVGGDIASNKKTYLLIKALELAKGDDKKKLSNFLEEGANDNDSKIKEVVDIYKKYKIKEITEEKASECFTQAMKSLNALNAPLFKKNMLKDYVIALMDREN